MPASDHPTPPISEQVWREKYRLHALDGTPLDATLQDTWRRVASAAAAAEPEATRKAWARRFLDIMHGLEFLPAGRIIAGAGTGRTVTLFNCFVMGRIEDDLGSIFDNLKEAALTMQQGGGIGHDFSTLRPAGALVKSVGAGASGPVSFMDVWDSMCRTIMSAGQRRGAMMGTLRCDHPDIETFIAAKAEAGRLRSFNMSVLVTDAFMQAVAADDGWDLVFAGKVYRRVRARELWARIMRATYEYAEPGVIFIDRVNALNNLHYCEDIRATNPCGEQPLPPHGACLLGSINLARLVTRPFTPEARLDEARLEALVPTAVRFLDDVIDISGYPLPTQRAEALAKRRIGLGVTGLADALAMCGAHYASDEARRLAGRWMEAIEQAAWRTSAALADEKGPFPAFAAEPFLSSPAALRQPEHVREAIRRHGMRNGCLTSIAPTGTISLLAHNVSSGIEPVFDVTYRRRIRDGAGVREEIVEDYAHAVYRRMAGPDTPLPPAFVTVADLTPGDHLAMQAAVQAHVDSAISKTINCPEDIPFAAFENVYAEAWRLGLKGCTTFRPNAVTGSVLASAGANAHDAPGPDNAADPPASSAETVTGSPAAGRTSSEPPGPRGVRSPTQPLEPAGTSVGPAAVSGIVPPPRLPAARPDARPIIASEPAVVRMAPPLKREPALAGFTYKLKWTGSDHALYVTINDIEQDGRRRPFEIFINTKNLEHYAWTVALTRMISAVFRRGGDVAFVVEELKAVFDPQGGQWMNGRYVPSLLAAIGEIIEGHMVRTGFLQATDARRATQVDDPAGSGGGGTPTAAAPTGGGDLDGRQLRRRCTRCGMGTMLLQSGCWTCRDCGYSKCG